MALAQVFVDNFSFAVTCLSVVALALALSVCIERAARRRRGGTERILSTRKLVAVGAFSAVATMLFCLDFPVFFAPSFYKMDFSELPALIAGFAYGPVAAVMVEFIKIVLKLVIKGTSTAFVGELANFVIGVSFLLPASVIYHFKKTKAMAFVSCGVGTLFITVVGAVFNAVYLLPAFSALYGMPMEAIIGMGRAINGKIGDVTSFVVLAVAPLNLVKGLLDSIITMAVYKKLSPILKGAQETAQVGPV